MGAAAPGERARRLPVADCAPGARQPCARSCGLQRFGAEADDGESVVAGLKKAPARRRFLAYRAEGEGFEPSMDLNGP
jgi:hypothetical protein